MKSKHFQTLFAKLKGEVEKLPEGKRAIVKELIEKNEWTLALKQCEGLYGKVCNPEAILEYIENDKSAELADACREIIIERKIVSTLNIFLERESEDRRMNSF